MSKVGEKLLAVFKEKGYTATSFAEKIGVSRMTVYNKLRGITDFTLLDIAVIRDALELTEREIIDIFLT